MPNSEFGIYSSLFRDEDGTNFRLRCAIAAEYGSVGALVANLNASRQTWSNVLVAKRKVDEFELDAIGVILDTRDAGQLFDNGWQLVEAHGHNANIMHRALLGDYDFVDPYQFQAPCSQCKVHYFEGNTLNSGMCWRCQDRYDWRGRALG